MLPKLLLATLLTAALPLALPTSLLAATPPTATEESHHHPLERIRLAVEHLHLNESQRTQIHAILEAAHAEIKPILAADKGNHEKLRADLRPILKATLEKITALLTPQQKHHLHELLAKEHAEK